MSGLAPIIGAAALAGCQPAAPAPTPTPSRGPAGPPTAEPTPAADARATPVAGSARVGGSVVWAADADPVSLDPYAATSDAALQAWGDVTYQSLTMFDDKLRVVPALAEAWTNPDPTTWLFKLRRGVRFHDGHELEPADVVFWYERIAASADSGAFAPIRKVEPTGASSVRVTLDSPHAPLLATFAGLRGSAIVSRRSAGQLDLARHAVGTGPFKIVEYVPGRHISYARHADYWERPLPYLDAVRLELAGAPAERVSALRSGQLRYAIVTPDEASQLADARSVRIVSGPGARQWVHHLNVARPPFHDVRVRRAVALALDRRAAVERLFGGHARLSGPIPTGLQEWGIAVDRLPYRRDLAAARGLLTEAGLPDGFATVIVTTAELAPRGISTLLAEQLRAIGVQADVHVVDRGAILQLMQARDFDVVADGNGFWPDPDGYLTPTYRGGGPRHLSAWSSDTFDGLIDRARTTVEPPDRAKLYEDAQAILLDEVPSIWWCTEDRLEAMHDSQQGYKPSFTGRRAALKTTWIDRSDRTREQGGR